jgi:hypothetical protein
VESVDAVTFTDFHFLNCFIFDLAATRRSLH